MCAYTNLVSILQDADKDLSFSEKDLSFSLALVTKPSTPLTYARGPPSHPPPKHLAGVERITPPHLIKSKSVVEGSKVDGQPSVSLQEVSSPERAIAAVKLMPSSFQEELSMKVVSPSSVVPSQLRTRGKRQSRSTQAKGQKLTPTSSHSAPKKVLQPLSPGLPPPPSDYEFNGSFKGAGPETEVSDMAGHGKGRKGTLIYKPVQKLYPSLPLVHSYLCLVIVN